MIKLDLPDEKTEANNIVKIQVAKLSLKGYFDHA